MLGLDIVESECVTFLINVYLFQKFMLQIAVLEVLPKIEASRCEAVSLYSRLACAR